MNYWLVSISGHILSALLIGALAMKLHETKRREGK